MMISIGIPAVSMLLFFGSIGRCHGKNDKDMAYAKFGLKKSIITRQNSERQKYSMKILTFIF